MLQDRPHHLAQALDHLPPAFGSRRSLPRSVPGIDRRADFKNDGSASARIDELVAEAAVWRSSVGAGHWDVELVQLIDGRAALLATLSLDEWIDLGATPVRVSELQQEGEGSS